MNTIFRSVSLNSLELRIWDRWLLGNRVYSYYKHGRTGSFLEGKRIGTQSIRSIQPIFGILKEGRQFLGHVLATSISPDKSLDFTANGWNSIVSKAAEDRANGSKRDWAVALHLLVEERARGKGVAKQLLVNLRNHCSLQGYSRLLVPLLLPTATSIEYCQHPSTSSLLEKRIDGEYRDHWLRLHTKLGACLAGVCDTSHVYGIRRDEMESIINRGAVESHIVEDDIIVLGENSRYYRFCLIEDYGVWLAKVPCIWVSHQVPGGSDKRREQEWELTE